MDHLADLCVKAYGPNKPIHCIRAMRKVIFDLLGTDPGLRAAKKWYDEACDRAVLADPGWD